MHGRDASPRWRRPVRRQAGDIDRWRAHLPPHPQLPFVVITAYACDLCVLQCFGHGCARQLLAPNTRAPPDTVGTARHLFTFDHSQLAEIILITPISSSAAATHRVSTFKATFPGAHQSEWRAAAREAATSHSAIEWDSAARGTSIRGPRQVCPARSLTSLGGSIFAGHVPLSLPKPVPSSARTGPTRYGRMHLEDLVPMHCRLKCPQLTAACAAAAVASPPRPPAPLSVVGSAGAGHPTCCSLRSGR